MYAVKGLKCSEGHTLLQNDLDKFRALYEHGDMELLLSFANGTLSGGPLNELKICCSLSLTNLAEHEGALDDVKHKFVPLVMKWTNEDQEIFTLMASAKPSKGKDPVLISIQDLAAEFLPWISRKMMLSGTVVEMKENFRLFLRDKKMEVEEEVEKEKERLAAENGTMDLEMKIKEAKDCFGPPLVCSNCESRGSSSKPKIECSSGSQCCREEELKLKRCSACHIVAYCSERCQREHWFSNHQKMCKVLSKKKKSSFAKHMTCINCDYCHKLNAQNDLSLESFVAKESLLIPCNVGKMQMYIVEHYWLHFGYHRDATCMCPREMKSRRRDEVNYPMQCPFSMGEMSGTYLGWIDEKLSVLTLFVNAINIKYHKEMKEMGTSMELEKIFKFLLTVRATYWYYVTNERRRYMTEVLFAQRLYTMSQILTDKGSHMFSRTDVGFKKLETKNIWWETFLHHLADFYRRLRWTHYQIFSTDIPEHRKEEFGILQEVHTYVQNYLSRPVQLLLPEMKMSNSSQTSILVSTERLIVEKFLITLPEGSSCFICKHDLTNSTAAWQLQNIVHQALWEVLPKREELTVDLVKEVLLVRYKGLPLVFEDTDMPGFSSVTQQLGSFHVACGRCNMDQCLLDLVNHQVNYFDRLARLTINWVFKTHKCFNCLKFCYESHRCSSCRSVRYCSKPCLLEDWKSHEDHCKELAKEPDEAILFTANVRKFNGEQREVFFKECVAFMAKVDPYFQYFSNRWERSGLDIDDIITKPIKPEKSKGKGRSETNDRESKKSKPKEKKKRKQRSTEASKKLEAAKENIMAKRCEGGDCEVGVPYAERVSELLAENGFDPSTMKVTRMAMAGPESEAAKKKQMEQTMNGFKHIGLDVGLDVKLNRDPFKVGKDLEFEQDTFKVGMDVDKENPILLQKPQQKEKITDPSGKKEELPKECTDKKEKEIENKDDEKPSEDTSVLWGNSDNIQMREVGYDEDTGVSTILIEKTDENGKKRTFLAGTKNFGKTLRQKTAEVSCQDNPRTEDTSSTTKESGNNKTQRQSNAEGLLKALQDDSVDFARTSGTIDLAERRPPEVSKECKTTEKEQKSEKEGLSVRKKCEEEVENEWKKLEMMMKALPDEAKRKLYESRVGNDPDKDLTMEEYNEMMAIVGPYLPSIPDIFSFSKKAKEEIKASESSTKAIREEGPKHKVDKELAEGPKCNVDKEKAGGSETISGLIEHFRNEILGKHFEIRHVKTHTWMNSRICKVEDVSVKKSIYDPRVVCSIKGESEDKRYSLKLTNMIDYCAHIDDIVGECCVEGKEFFETRNVLHSSYVARELHDAMQWLATKDTRRDHQIHRLKLLKTSGFGESPLKCMEYPEESDMTNLCHVSATLAAVRPGCLNDGTVDFSKFGQYLCGCSEEEQVSRRFREFLNSGMCHACQIYYLEMQRPNINEGETLIGQMFAMLSRSSPSIYYGSKGDRLKELGVDRERFYQFCKLIDTCFECDNSNRQTVKLVRNFVRATEKVEKERGGDHEPLTNRQFEACLDMMKEAKILKQAGNSLIQLKSYTTIPESYPYPQKKDSLF